ncbi:RHS repeat-associated core domain-containing protein [Sorangium sp. So ce381]|uniref:RHS repeat-associated core domain-containing protein n=1 Tax=Sorangium sp. So ce381 TaxID=3133307 RepID=UPI003F5BF334
MRTAPAPNIPAIPGMNPGVFVMGGGGGGGGSGGKGGGGSTGARGADGRGGGSDANGGGKSAGSCGTGSTDGGGCPNHHGPGTSGTMSRGDPVDVVTGRVFTLPAVDLFLPSPLPLRIERTYSSTSRDRDVGLGPGWTFSLAWQVIERRRSVRVITSDGVEHDFGKLEPAAGVLGPHGWLLHREGLGFRLDLPDGPRLIFEVQVPSDDGMTYRLSAIADRWGNRIVLDHEQGHLVQVTDATGRVVRVVRGRDGHIAALEAKNALEQGRWVPFVRYSYDAHGRLTGAEDADGELTTYAYDERNLLTSTTGPTGLTFFFRYDAASRCVETWGEAPGATDISLAEDVPAVLADHETKARGVLHTKFEYGDDGYSEAVDSVGLHRYFGNAHGLVAKAVTPLGVFLRSYDDRGFLTSFTDALGATTTWERDLFGRETRVVDPLGRVTTIRRDPAGEILEVIGPDGASTRVHRAGDELSWTDPLGATCIVRFDARGQPVRAEWPDGRTIVFARDAHGNVIERVDELGARTQAGYDAWGRCVEILDARGGRTAFTYSNAGRLLSVRSPDGAIERYAHDGAGNTIAITDAEGRTTRLSYGGFHKLSRIEKPNGEVVELRYNREGWLSYVKNARGEIYRFTRNPAGPVVEEHAFDGRVTRYGHDAMGRVVWSRNGLGERTEYERDAAGRLVRRVFADGTEESFEHDENGDIVAAACPAGLFVFQRNPNGWIVREEQHVAGERADVRIDYRLTGEVAGRRTSLGHAAQWTHDFARGQVQLALDGEVASASQNDVLGREVARVLPGGTRIEAAYDALGRLSERRVIARAAAPAVGPGQPAWVGPVPPATVRAEAFRYTSDGLLAMRLDQRRGTTQFSYDPIGQLARVLREGREEASFRYDETGNVHDVTPGAPGRLYGPGDRIERCGAERYVWDAEGRLVARRERRSSGEEAVTRYRWSAAGRLDAVERPDGTVVSFEYDPFARRVAKRLWRREVNGRRTLLEATRFVWDGGALVHEIKHSAAAGGAPVVEERTYVFEQGSTIPFAHRDARTEGGVRTVSPWWHYVNDDSGAPEALMGPDGRLGCELLRAPWGAVAVADGASTSTPIRFRGQYADEETGLFYNRHRYYDPKLGRYISPDPIGIEGGLNAFAYAANCPTSAVDPDGLMYSVIKDARGNVVAEGHNLKQGGGVGEQHPAVPLPDRTSCAEMTALTSLARKMGPNTKKEDIAKLFNEEGYTIETYEGTRDTYKQGVRYGANPCPACKKMFNDMGITKGILGHAPRKPEKIRPWDGETTYTPLSEQVLQQAQKRRR